MNKLAVLFHLALVVAWAAWLPSAGIAAPPKPPHIVFLLIDDLGFSDVGFNGSKDIRTPHCDKLAKEGVILGSHYVQPVCSPTRAALMTGRYATHTGVYTVVRPHSKWGLPLEERTLADALRESGYETAVVGKWHLGEFQQAYQPNARGFDHQYGHFFGALDYFTKMRDNSHDWYRDGKELHEEGYATNQLADEACRLIANRDKQKPLFLYVPFNAVHAPLQVPPKYLEQYGTIKGQRRNYAGMMSAVDEAIGQIVAALEKAQMRDDTLIVFSSDNGGPNPGTVSTNGSLRAGKGTIYEGGVRVCAFANWPKHLPAGKKVDQPMHIIDWYPTLLNLAGGKSEQKLPVDGRDVWPMLTQDEPSPHDALLLVQSPGKAAIRSGDWKLLHFGIGSDEAEAEEKQPKQKKPAKVAAQERVELYNLADDLGEKNDLAAENPEKVAQLKQQLAQLLKDAAPPGDRDLPASMR